MTQTVSETQNLRTSLVREALRWPGHDFHPGVPCQCAAFVAACLDRVGYNAPAWQAFPNKAWVPDYQSLGIRVATIAQLRAGDLVIFGHTYVDEASTHIGIYVGDGDFVHRPTAAQPVVRDSLSSGYFQQHFQEGRCLFPSDTTGTTSTPTVNDGQVQGGPPTRRVQLYAHDGKASLVLDGAPLALSNVACTCTVDVTLGTALTLTAAYRTPTGTHAMLKLFHHDELVHLVLDGIEQPVLDAQFDLHLVPGKPAGVHVAVEADAATPALPSTTPTGKAYIGQLLDQAAVQYGIPVDTLKAVAWQESGWDPNALSYDGQHGKGVMQIDDRYHAFARTPAVFDPVANIAYGAQYLKQLFTQEGTWSAALTDYNGSSAYAGLVLALAQSRPWR